MELTKDNIMSHIEYLRTEFPDKNNFIDSCLFRYIQPISNCERNALRFKLLVLSQSTKPVKLDIKSMNRHRLAIYIMEKINSINPNDAFKYHRLLNEHIHGIDIINKLIALEQNEQGD